MTVQYLRALHSRRFSPGKGKKVGRERAPHRALRVAAGVKRSLRSPLMLQGGARVPRKLRGTENRRWGIQVLRPLLRWGGGEVRP